MNPLKRLNRSRNSRVHPDAHITWASRSISATVTRTGLYLQKQLWIWPIVAVVVLSTIGYFMGNAIESTIKGNVSSGMQTLVDLEAEMLTKWFSVQESAAEALANDATVRRTVYQLFQTEQPASSPASPDDPHKELAAELGPAMSAHDFDSYLLIDKSKRIVSATHAALVGEQGISEYEPFINRALAGEAFVSPPFPSVVMMKDADGRSRMGVPTMYVCAPIRDPSFQVVGVLALQIRPEREFIPILQLGRTGESGETYAFNEDGIMISNSRFDEELILMGLLPDQPHSHSILQMSVRDPGVDMTRGFRPNRRRSQMPLTTMAADAIAGNSGLDVDGYRDYRGKNVIGAWRWLPKYQMGVAIEVDADQAFRPIVILQRTFLTIFILLMLCAIVIFAFTLIVARLQRQSREAVIEAQQLGQYTLDQKLGEGAMGVVYKGHHSMLRRPTAIKLLHADKVNDTSIARFEREVQITCQLNHSNTIAIYDYGRTPEGVFYYAMEYLDGIDLQDLVNKYGTQSEARVIHILLQICGSLFEAHSQGLVHRDIKPANVMLNRRGCEPDVVKVLDFGLVKAVDRTEGSPANEGSSMSGTPLYMSPESIQAPMTVDACSDIYAVGAVGYFLLTGKPVFEAANLVDLCQKHIEESPVPPSKRGNVKVSSQLEDAIMGCLEKSRAKRPQTARDLGILISKCAAASDWTIEEADRWWGRHERGSENRDFTTSTAGSSSTESAAMDATMDQSFNESPNDSD